MHSLAQDPLRHATERSQQYWVSDGIPFIVMGAFWMTWGAVLLLPVLFPGTTIVRFMSIIVIAVMALAGLLMKPIIHRWKERVTFPRTGYIKLRQASTAFLIAIVIITGVATFVTAWLVRFNDRTAKEWLPLGFGLLLVVGMLHSSWKMRSARLAMFSTIVTAVVLMTFYVHLTGDLSYAVLMLTAGCACVLEGPLTFRTYLRSHPLPAGDVQ